MRRKNDFYNDMMGQLLNSNLYLKEKRLSVFKGKKTRVTVHSNMNNYLYLKEKRFGNICTKI